jgi:serine/threonine protein kinase
LSEDFAVQLAGLQPGSLLAGYRLEARVGAGGMAVVFRARDERLGRLVAVKVLAPGLATDPGFRRRFIAESRAAAAVDDPHIIPIYEAGEAGGALFIAMRFVGGGDLRKILDREGALPPGRAVQFISPVASALDAAHAVGLVHRDVKPANILVDTRRDRSDHVYLSDFGVSKGAISSLVSLTGAGHFLGTPAYAAPEQIQGLVVDGRADQYALACVAFQLLSGVPPFGRDQEMAVLFAHLSEPPPSLGSRRPGLPGAVDAVLARGMAKVPEKRFGSCAEFAGALHGALGLASTSVMPGPGRPPSPSGTARSIVKQPLPDGSTTAATIDSMPDGAGAAARTGPGHAHSRPPSPGPRWRRLLPLAAAAVIIIIIIAVATILAIITQPKAGSGASATGGATKVVYAEGGRVPPYYVWISSRGNPNFSPNYAAVRLTATGAVLGTVTASAPGGTVVAVAGAADDRTFVLDEQTWANYNTNSGNQPFEPRTFYLLHLNASGKPELITRLPISLSAGEMVDGLALSPDGTKLAIGIYPRPQREPNMAVLKLYSIPAGRVLRTWYGNGQIGFSGEDPEALSWTSDQGMLGFRWQANGTPSQAGEWLLDLGKGGTGLIGDSKYIVPWSLSWSLACDTDMIITPDGSHVICGASDYNTSSGFEEFSTTPGKPAQTLAEWSTKNDQTEVLWTNPSGSVLIGTAPAGKVGMITAGTFTALPALGAEFFQDQGAW